MTTTRDSVAAARRLEELEIAKEGLAVSDPRYVQLTQEMRRIAHRLDLTVRIEAAPAEAVKERESPEGA